MSGPSFTAKAGELYRVIQIMAAKSGGRMVFPVVGLDVKESLGTTTVTAEHADKGNSISIKVVWYGAKSDPGTEFAIATNQPDHIIDYLGKTFVAEEPVELTHDTDAHRIVLSNGYRRATLGTVAVESVPRPQGPQGKPLYGVGPNQLWVGTNDARRPTHDVDKWESWVAQGYTVVHVPKAVIAQLLDAGDLVTSHGSLNVTYQFAVMADGVGVVVKDRDNPDSEVVNFERLPGVTMPPGVNPENFALSYNIVSPLWQSLKSLESPGVAFVHHPAENAVNLLAAEDTKDGKPWLRLTALFLTMRGQRTPRGPPRTPAPSNPTHNEIA